MTTTTVNDKCPDCGCEAPAHFGRCPRLSPEVRAFAEQQEREMAERQTERDKAKDVTTDRQRKFEAMKRNTTHNAANTTVYGIPLATMNADEIRIAALWLASQFPKGIAPHHG